MLMTLIDCIYLVQNAELDDGRFARPIDRGWEYTLGFDARIFKFDLYNSTLLFSLPQNIRQPTLTYLEVKCRIGSDHHPYSKNYKQSLSKNCSCVCDPATISPALHKSSDMLGRIMQAEHVLTTETRPGSSESRRTFQLRVRPLLSSLLPFLLTGKKCNMRG